MLPFILRFLMQVPVYPEEISRTQACRKAGFSNNNAYFSLSDDDLVCEDDNGFLSFPTQRAKDNTIGRRMEKLAFAGK